MSALPVVSGAQRPRAHDDHADWFWITQAVCAAVTFDLADHLASGSDTAEAIARRNASIRTPRGGGKKRDLAEFDALFATTGLRRTTVGQAGQFAFIETVRM